VTREERIAKVRGGRWIRYPLADRIAAKLEELLLLPKAHRMPNLLIVGETNNGKTALLSRIVLQPTRFRATRSSPTASSRRYCVAGRWAKTICGCWPVSRSLSRSSTSLGSSSRP
jgi:hypothetical protein